MSKDKSTEKTLELQLPEESSEPVNEIQEVQSEPATERKLSEAEHKAMQFGWKPKDEYEGDPNEWKPAKAFLQYGDMVGKIRELEKTIDALVKHNTKIEEDTRKKTVEELKLQQRQAAEMGDVDTVTRITDKIATAHQPPVFNPQVPPEVNEFLSRNQSWYNGETAENAAMSAYAIKRDNDLLVSQPSLNMRERLALVEQEVKKTFGHRFSNPLQDRPQVVTAPSHEAKKSTTRAATVHDLTEEQRRIYQQFAKIIPGYTVEKYAKALKEDGGQ